MNPELEYYSQPGQMTDPGSQAGWLDGLPTGIGELCRLVQGTMIHIFWAERYGMHLPSERQEEVQLRTLERRLKRMMELDQRPLIVTRSLENKIVGNCRDFSLLLASILRHQGAPARARCGFGKYFQPNRYEDHWVCEYWEPSQNRWVLVDAQLDEFQRNELKISFNPLDIPRDQFIVAGKAWQLCRTAQADADAFGIFDMHGLGFVRGNLVRDVASLNKMELLPWDCWGIIEAPEPIPSGDLAFLDELADLISGDTPDFMSVRRHYESDSRVRMEGSLHSYVNGRRETVKIT